ncbi:flagella biosynthesis regulatory protein FliT [Klebsiella aerogenes]|uniref:flagella biosynthesis regulatory protein FliT n=1 Tax=Klebsiella aerogenes TaxID=548 RepID=UPI00035C0EB6|nr:flagella biosynthesis regulatory protein FliT [Klebsiella aerogenes]EIX9031598.1 flagella biosynthesis regulatory protein FliT [Klebsiella aerogenes]EKJ9785309.1 flagella biosynthesis regulatory protein FliT [Klebsiella aerogenes]EKQ6527584.1 flagella biosynthesis regulatory protein FliT [Klebsiella aerogenes]EKU6526683.1 flagella biosynthesis regulatory protein FliT [Klebsiella aerogenes]EKW6693188.1 flagella biosynthesis regulatory protein FliT [Klebsiella aerogenes]
MERQQQLLAAYQQIHTLSSQMIALARAGQWEALVEMQFAYVTAVEKTAEFTGKAGPSLALQEMLNAKLKQIIDNEGVLKGLLQQRMEQLKRLIDQSTRQNAVNTAYGQFDDRSLLLGELQSDNVVAIKSKSEELQ